MWMQSFVLWCDHRLTSRSVKRLKLSAGKKYLAHAEIIVMINAWILDIKIQMSCWIKLVACHDLDDHVLKTIVEMFSLKSICCSCGWKAKKADSILHRWQDLMEWTGLIQDSPLKENSSSEDLTTIVWATTNVGSICSYLSLSGCTVAPTHLPKQWKRQVTFSIFRPACKSGSLRKKYIQLSTCNVHLSVITNSYLDHKNQKIAKKSTRKSQLNMKWWETKNFCPRWRPWIVTRCTVPDSPGEVISSSEG